MDGLAKFFMRLMAGLSFVALTACEPMIIDGCESTTDIKVYCGLDKPEDIEPLGEHPWLLISELGGQETPGNITALNLETDDLVRLSPLLEPDDSFPQCGPPPSELSPRGFQCIRQGNVYIGGFVEAISLTKGVNHTFCADAKSLSKPPRNFIAGQCGEHRRGGGGVVQSLQQIFAALKKALGVNRCCSELEQHNYSGKTDVADSVHVVFSGEA